MSFILSGGGLDKVLSLLSNKVDKITGKGLSSNDYTNTDKNIVDGVTSALSGKVDKVNGKGLSTNDYSNTDKNIVDGVTSALAGKADTSAIPTKTSQLTNDSGFITNSVNNLTNYYTKSNTYTKTEVDNKFNTVGSFTTVSGKYTTASWAIGTNTCTWTAPATGTYIVWIYFWMDDDSKSAIYKQFQFHGNAKFSIGNALFYEPDGGKVTATVISQPVTANAGQVVTPYVHTGTAGVVFTVVISGMRIK